MARNNKTQTALMKMNWIKFLLRYLWLIIIIIIVIVVGEPIISVPASFVRGGFDYFDTIFTPLGQSTGTNPTQTVEQTNLQIVEQIAIDYHNTHTYSEPDLFVCSDMAIDVWNMIKTRGINAQIAVGNVEKTGANITEYNHAWVMAETHPFKWVAVETTGGYLVWGENVIGENIVKNDLYYWGLSFDNPNELKAYLDLMKQYDLQQKELLRLVSEGTECISELEKMNDEFNNIYVGRTVTSESISARDSLNQKAGECKTLTDELTKEVSVISDIVSQMNGLSN